MLFVEKMIKKLRAKGYDDFYMANLAGKYDWMCFFPIWLLEVAIVVGIFSLISRLLGIMGSSTLSGLAMKSIAIIACSAMFIFLFSFSPEFSIHTKKDEGESDLRISYLIGSWVSRLMLKVFRYAPIIAMAILPIVLISCIWTQGFRWQMLLSSAVGIVLLIVCSPFYHKALRHISKEGSYYVDWKTNQDVEHFEETYSRHEKWWLSEAEMEFEKFNVDRYRSIRLSAFIGTFASLLGGVIFALSLTPLFRMDLNPGHSKTSKVENVVTPKIDETQQATELSATTDNEMEEEADVVEDNISSEYEYGEQETVAPESRNVVSEKKEDSPNENILSKRKLSYSDIADKTSKELELMRNSIYARHGYKFKRKDLADYFSQFPWYTPTTSNSEDVRNQMNDIEVFNIDYIKSHE